MIRILIAASGTGGHLFPALAVAEQLEAYQVEWLGVADRLDRSLVPQSYDFHIVPVEGFQGRFRLKTLKVIWNLITSVFKVKSLLNKRKIDIVFTTGGYIAGPAILAARWQGIPAILHESNYIPGKVTRWFSPLCQTTALGFPGTKSYLPRSRTLWVSTPVRQQFLTPQTLALEIPPNLPLIVVVGGSQGAVALNQLVRQCLLSWVEAGAFIVHLTGRQDPEADSLEHPRYMVLPFYENMAGLLQRADLAISRAGAGTLTELAVSATPAILVPYPFAAEDHQTYNAQVFVEAGAAKLFAQADLTALTLKTGVLSLLRSPQQLQEMKQKMSDLAVLDSAEQLAKLIKQQTKPNRRLSGMSLYPLV